MSESGPGRAAATDVVRLAGLGALWGATFPIARVALTAGADPFVVVTIDLFLAAAVMAGLAAASRTPWPGARPVLRSLGIGALLIGGINLPLFWGEQYATGGAAAIVYATAPLVSLAAVAVAGRTPSVGRLGGPALALGLFGIVFLTVTSGGTGVLSSPWAVAAFSLGAVCQGTGTVLLARTKPGGEDRWGLSFEFLGGSAAALAVLPVFVTSGAFPLDASVVFSVAYIALGTLVVGYTVFFALVRRVGPVRANLVTYVNPLAALAVGVVAFAEPFDPFELVGLAAVLVALAWLHRPVRSSDRPPTGAWGPRAPDGRSTSAPGALSVSAPGRSPPAGD